MKGPGDSDVWTQERLVRGVILVFWTCFWLFNVVDKAIGGSTFLWVGRDRFAQFQKYFASAGLESPLIADAALYVAAALEVFALVFFAGALWNFVARRVNEARSCFIGIVITLVTFTFSIGDHLFGRFELLEHTLFGLSPSLRGGCTCGWKARTASLLRNMPGNLDAQMGQKCAAWAGALVVVTTASVFKYNTDFFYRRTAALEAELVGEDLFKVAFPFLGGSQVFEATLAKFKREHPDKSIDHIYTAPNPLRLKKADALIFYIATKDRVAANPDEASTHE